MPSENFSDRLHQELVMQFSESDPNAWLVDGILSIKKFQVEREIARTGVSADAARKQLDLVRDLVVSSESAIVNGLFGSAGVPPAWEEFAFPLTLKNKKSIEPLLRPLAILYAYRNDADSNVAECLNAFDPASDAGKATFGISVSPAGKIVRISLKGYGTKRATCR